MLTSSLFGNTGMGSRSSNFDNFQPNFRVLQHLGTSIVAKVFMSICKKYAELENTNPGELFYTNYEMLCGLVLPFVPYFTHHYNKKLPER